MIQLKADKIAGWDCTELPKSLTKMVQAFEEKHTNKDKKVQETLRKRKTPATQAFNLFS